MFQHTPPPAAAECWGIVWCVCVGDAVEAVLEEVYREVVTGDEDIASLERLLRDRSAVIKPVVKPVVEPVVKLVAMSAPMCHHVNAAHVGVAAAA